MADSTLGAIRSKVRRLTRSPKSAQITQAQIDEYINTALLYDLPEQLRLFSLKETLTFYTQPNVERYGNNTIDSSHPLFDFINKYITIEKPLYVDGYEQFFSQDRTQFYNLYPRLAETEDVGTGDGVTNNFTGTLTNKPVLSNRIAFTTLDVNNIHMAMVGVPVLDSSTGIPTNDANLYLAGSEPTTAPTAVTPNNTINYVTGVFAVTYPSAALSGEDVIARTVPVESGRPTSVFFFDNEFIFRPVPDDVYRVNVDVYVQPTELLNQSDRPELDQWWQYISYLAAKKIFEDRMDLESVQKILPELKNQERLVLRRTIVQQTKERTASIYTDQLERGGWYWWGQNF